MENKLVVETLPLPPEAKSFEIYYKGSGKEEDSHEIVGFSILDGESNAFLKIGETPEIEMVEV